MSSTRHHNNGLRKICDCGRRAWSKCAHDWHFNFTWRGTVHRFSLDRHLGRPMNGRTDAETEAEKLRIAIREGKFGTNQPQIASMTLRQLVALYTERAKASRAQDSVDVLYRTPLPRPAGGELAFGDWPIVDITTDTIERFRQARATRTLVTRPGQQKARVAGGTVAANRHLAFLRAVFNWAIRMGYTERTPFKRGTEAVVKLAQELPRRRRLEGGEQERLFAKCAPHVRLVVEAALETGCRVGELLSLQWSQIEGMTIAAVTNPGADEAKFLVTWDPRAAVYLPALKTKTKRDRRIPISPRLRAVLEMQRGDGNGDPRPGEQYVFGNYLGQRIGSIDHAFARACDRAKLEDLHFHDLRREAGSRWLEAGVPLNVVKELLGHTNISQTSTYLGVTEAATYDALRRFWSQTEIASPCMSGQNNGAQSATNDRGARHEDTENIDENRSDVDTDQPENRSVDSSILSLATIFSNNLEGLEKRHP